MGLEPGDLIRAAAQARAALRPAAAGAGWGAPAGDLEWDCRRTLDHVLDALVFYAVHLATRATARRPSPRDGDAAVGIEELLDGLESFAHILASVASAAPPGTRAFHPSGMADVEGFVAMGCDEILVHTADCAGGLGIDFRPDPALCARIVARLFPWAPAEADPWEALLWASGRAPLGDRPRLGPDWSWWSRPLEEWDGTASRRRAPPGWT